MFSKIRPALIITRREIRDQFRDWRIIFPIIVLTVIFPTLMNFTARQAVNFVEQYGAPVVAERLIPFLLMVVGFFPISVSLVIALESFVGEKERRSIEPLLSSPLSDVQLYLGKLMAAMFPPLLASYLGIIVYLTGVYRQIDWRPEPTLLVQIILLTTVQAIVMVSGAVVVSSQTTSVRAANLLASFIIIPMSFLIQGESIVMFWARYNILWWAILGLVVIAGLLIRTGVAYFNREELLGRELDVLNFRWSWHVFVKTFRGRARSVRETLQHKSRKNPFILLSGTWQSLIEWYRLEILNTLRQMIVPIICMTLVVVMGIAVGINLSTDYTLPPEAFSQTNINQGFIEGLEAIRFFTITSVGTVWLHNLQVIAIATLLGIFSFGILGVLVMSLPLILISYLAANVGMAGMSPIEYIAGLVLPHGLLEIPAIILCGAAILNLGATLITPADGKTIGEAFLVALARWAKILVGIALPLFLIAALVEVFITPQVALAIFGG